jgi:hypothetical protein
VPRATTRPRGRVERLFSSSLCVLVFGRKRGRMELKGGIGIGIERGKWGETEGDERTGEGKSTSNYFVDVVEDEVHKCVVAF